MERQKVVITKENALEVMDALIDWAHELQGDEEVGKDLRRLRDWYGRASSLGGAVLTLADEHGFRI